MVVRGLALMSDGMCFFMALACSSVITLYVVTFSRYLTKKIYAN